MNSRVGFTPDNQREQPLGGSSDAIAAYLPIRVPLNIKVMNKNPKLRHAQLDVEY
jgi:hypothetical protein